MIPGGVLHGLRNHPDLHNPVTFEFDVAEETKFIVAVGDVSDFRASGIIGKDMGLVWVQNAQYTWTSSARAKAVQEAVVIMSGKGPLKVTGNLKLTCLN